MIGWGVALALLAAYIIVTIVWNTRFRARQRQLAQSRPGHDDRRFLDLLADRGVPVLVSNAVLAELRPYYCPGVAPHPDDRLDSVLHIDPEEIEDIVKHIWAELALPIPSSKNPEQVPAIDTVGKLAAYLGDRHAALAA